MTTPTGGALMEKKSMNSPDEIKKIKYGGGEIKVVCFITAFGESYNEFERLFPKLQIDCFIRKPYQ